MTECDAKSTVRALIEETASTAAAGGMPHNELQGIAFFNMESDAFVIALKSFDAAEQKIIALPNFIGRLGSEGAKRIVLQLVYQYFRRVDRVVYQKDIFESLWCDLEAELADAYWVLRGVANIRNFTSNQDLMDLGDGITIRARSQSDLALLGFDQTVWDRIAENWHGPGGSAFVLVADYSVLKQPDNLTSFNTYDVSLKATRAVGALRLADAGSISIGPMWVVRAAHFNAGWGGLNIVGASIPASGSAYSWGESVARAYPSIYRALATLEKIGYGRSPGNLQVALRAFMATYDRWPAYSDSQIIDAITAIEALLGTETEISYRLSLRVAALLAANDDERGTLFNLMRDFYDARSKIVHGAHLKDKQQKLLQRIEELRGVVRRLLRSFVVFAEAPREGYDKAFWKRLDVALLNVKERDKLRAALGLPS